MKRKLFGVFLSLALVLSMMPMGMMVAQAAEVASGTCGDNVTWTLDTDGLLIISGTGPMKDYYHSTEWGAYTDSDPVPWANYRAQIKSVVIENGVTTVGDQAFLRCGEMTSISLPNTITGIGDYAFRRCSKLQDFTMPESITSIGREAFSMCNALVHVVLPAGMTEVPQTTINSCSNLTSITIPDSITMLGPGAFTSNPLLSSVTFHGALTEIGTYAFSGAALPSLILTVSGKDAEIGSTAFNRVPAGAVVIYGEAGGTVESGASSKNYTFAVAHNVIKFNANGGSGTAMGDLPVTFDNTDHGRFPACSYTNGDKVFTGWNTKADGSGRAVEDQSPVTVLTENNGTATLYAQWADPGVYVAGTLITEENKDDVFGDGTVKLEGTTLTLSGFTGAGNGSTDPVIFSRMPDLTVALEGNNAIVCDTAPNGILAIGSVTFTGSGSLAISGGTEPIHAVSVTAASGFTGTLAVQGGIVSEESVGIAAGTVNIQGGTVLATGGFSSTASSGVKGAVTVSGGVLYAQGGETRASSATSYGISGNTTVNGGAVVARAGLIHPKGTSYPDDQFASVNRRAISGTLTTSGASVAAKIGYSDPSDKTSRSTDIENANATGIFIVGSGYSSVTELPASVTGDIYHVDTTYNTYSSSSVTDLNLSQGKTALFVNLVENGESGGDPYGLWFNGGSLTVSGGGKLISIGGIATDDYSYGIYTDSDLAVDGSAVIGVGGPSEGSNYGVYVNSKLTIASGSITGVGGQTFYNSNSYGLCVSGKTSASGTACVLGLGGDQLDYYSYGYRGNYDYGIEIRDQAQVFGIGGDTAKYGSTGIDGTVRAYGGAAVGLGGRSYGTSEGFDDRFYCYYGGRVVGMASTSTSNSGSQGAWGVGEIGGTVVLSGQTSSVSGSGMDVFPVGDWCDMAGYSDPGGTVGKTALAPGTATYNDVYSYKRIETKPLGEPYDLWVGGVHVLSNNKDDITAAINAKQPNTASGTAVYTPATADSPAKLELTDFSFKGTGYHKAWSDSYRTYDAYCAIYTTGDLEIVLTGDNTVTEASAEPANGRMSYGIRNDPAVKYGDSPALTFSGTGTMTAIGGDYTKTTFTRGSGSAGLYLDGELILKDTVSVIGVGGNVDTKAEVRSVGWTIDKTANTYGVLAGVITVPAGTSLQGVGGKVTLTDDLPEDPPSAGYYSKDVVLNGYSCGIRGYLGGSGGVINGQGGNITLNSEYEGGSYARYLEGYSEGVALNNGTSSNLAGTMTATGGSLSKNCPENFTRTRAESYGLLNNGFTFTGTALTARGETRALYNNQYVSFTNVHTVLSNTENQEEGAQESTITSGYVYSMPSGTETYNKYIKIFSPYTVTVTAGENMTRDTDSGEETQYVAAGGDMTGVVYTADEGYYFPTDYAVAAVNGINVTRDSYTQITVSGTPTADAAITLIAPTAKAKLATPTASFAVTDDNDLIISGLEESGAYSVTLPNASTVNYTAGTTLALPDITPGEYSIRAVPVGDATNEHIASDAVAVTITKAATPALTPTQPTEEGGTGSIPTTAVHKISTNGITWMACEGTSENLAEGTYYVRTAARGTVLASDAQTIIIKYTAPSTGGGGGGAPSYKVEVPDDVENGSVAVKPTSAKEGDTVTITPTPDEGFVVEDMKVTDKDGKEIEVKDNGDGTYSFVMPDGPVTVTPKFKPSADHVDYCPAKKFTDVDITQWHHLDLDYVLNKGMMNGTSDTTFEPQSTTNRAMIVTILWRLEGEPKAKESAFTDLTQDWYKAAVGWAAENGIVNGTSATTFAPTDPITREQFAAILYRYADHKKYDVSQKADLNKYTDADSISGYAQDAFGWANAAGLINGMTETTLAPQGNATRAQAAAILHRFCEKVAK